MPRRKAKKLPPRQRGKGLDPTDFDIDLAAILEEIEPYLESLTNAEIGRRAGGLPKQVVSDLRRGHRKPSLAAVAGIAHAAGGSLVVRFKKPRKRSRKEME